MAGRIRALKRIVRGVVRGSNRGRWDWHYEGLREARPYDDEATYRLAAGFLNDVAEIEDWGCGSGGFRPFCQTRYIGVDGSQTPFADRIADLRRYRSRAEGILLRHVLEHDYGWKRILDNAVASFERKLCVVLFTPFSERTRAIAYDDDFEVPDISFAEPDLIARFAHCDWRLDENLATASQYGIEHVFYIEKRSA